MRTPYAFLLLILSTLSNSVLSDDTELFVSVLPEAAQPNVMIVMDTSGSMCAVPPSSWIRPCSVANTRDKIARSAISQFLQTVENINISLMAFNNYPPVGGASGGSVVFASENISTARSSAINAVENEVIASWQAATPLTETLHEAYLYFSGKTPKYGNSPTFLYPDQKSVPESMSAGKYISPINYQCQKSNIIVFTDGAPGGDDRSDVDVRNFISSRSLPPPLSKDCRYTRNPSTSCFDEMAWYLQNSDINESIPDNQNINVYTIAGFGAAPPALLTSAANHGGGKYYDVSNSDDLVDALTEIVLEVKSEGATFTAPASSTSAFNSLEASDDVFYILFEPEAGPGWRGNLKKYRLGDDKQVYDANGNLAIDPETGFFSEKAQSFWSSSVDGKSVDIGGMVEQLNQNRPVFTNTTGDKNENLSIFSNKLHESNSNITLAMLGASDNSERDSILRWARGVDIDDEDSDGVTSDNRTSIGDPLHTQPIILTYYKDSATSTTDKTVFFSTNDGFLHAVNSDNGATEFSFIPKELLDNLKVYRNGYVSGGPVKAYGLDGQMTAWINDVNGDGDILSSNNGLADNGEHIYLYLTMRRGGNNIYALDITDRSQPVLKWIIKGDIDNNHVTDPYGDFGRLGQSWSRPMFTNVIWKGKKKPVLFFSGGYDVSVDDDLTIETANIGNAVFMVDAETGQMLWRASNNNSDLNITDLTYSLPSNLTLVDLDQDGISEVLFGSDSGGQLFRIDINSSNTGASNFASGGIIAKLSGSGVGDARRFFEAVDVSLSKDRSYLNLAIGSGFRSSPLSTYVNDRVYVIRDPHVSKAPTSYRYSVGSIITESSLYDATSNLIQDGTTSQQNSALSSLDSGNGWYLKLEDAGEKILSKVTVFQGILFFTSFVPRTAASTTCAPGSGNNYLYGVNIENGAAIFNFDTLGDSSDLDKTDRRKALKNTTIAPAPTILVKGNEGAEICVGTECFNNILKYLGPIPAIRKFWRENR